MLVRVCGLFLFRLLMKAHIELHKFAHVGFLDRLSTAPPFVCDDHLAELRTPIAQMVDGDGMIAQEFIDAVE